MNPTKTKTVTRRTFYIDLETQVDCWTSPTFYAHIFVGLKPGYDGTENYKDSQRAFKICQDYCDEVGLAVTFEQLNFIYKNGNEQGIKVGLINYPRYPRTRDEITKTALDLASKLKDEFDQFRVSVVTSDMTYMIGEID